MLPVNCQTLSRIRLLVKLRIWGFICPNPLSTIEGALEQPKSFPAANIVSVDAKDRREGTIIKPFYNLLVQSTHLEELRLTNMRLCFLNLDGQLPTIKKIHHLDAICPILRRKSRRPGTSRAWRISNWILKLSVSILGFS
jgi:hypothetical protein